MKISLEQAMARLIQDCENGAPLGDRTVDPNLTPEDVVTIAARDMGYSDDYDTARFVG
tara:strand:+ start:357 stop:530 length:174 start_codon:yes stop_codon:yes gene_type:complete